MGFTVAQTARLTGTTPAQLRSWERLRLVVSGAGGRERYSFRDLVAVRIVVSLLDAGLALDRVRRALRYVVEAGHDVGTLSLVTDGDAVWACVDDRQVLDALRRRAVTVFVDVGRIATDVETEMRAFDAEKQAFVDELHASSADPDATNGAAMSGPGDAETARGAPHRRAAPS